MIYIIFVALSLVLLLGFVFLTRYEMQHSGRFFANGRTRFDAQVDHVRFILTHIDLSAFVREEVQRIGRHAGHTIAHLSLKVVREVERFLTRAVRRLRVHHAPMDGPRESARPFVKSLSEFKDTLKKNAPDIDPF